MIYKEAATTIIDSVYGLDNISAIRKKPGEICIVVHDKNLVREDKLKNLKHLKKIQIVGNKYYLYFKPEDLKGIFNAFKNIPTSNVRIRKRDEVDEENNDLPLATRLKNLFLGDLLPLIIGLGFSGYLLGIISYVGMMLK